jgi:heterotetrameric sarcosine oxidase delta subunit
MTLRITCDHCGTRAINEFVHGEVVDVPEGVYSDGPDGDDARDVDRAYMHNNTAGDITEAWFHLYRCRRWVHLSRNTETDDFL